ncbi:hypothetical protein PHLGIDRAFT_128065 [Phlebiopsis gigantea 11061_1 CR5-6]|uniref:Uncharacterized protein n=1 Tax=Phlebiopsis gigantea (strain 11061_1 CR5-6) TaxID=745531 RepID=A0A0C3NP01_PHLG1|nr:hypothetical protein PHLGIDRAFT_128065 [Phlebiopsis gigantea 11061_1 CR5-6]
MFAPLCPRRRAQLLPRIPCVLAPCSHSRLSGKASTGITPHTESPHSPPPHLLHIPSAVPQPSDISHRNRREGRKPRPPPSTAPLDHFLSDACAQIHVDSGAEGRKSETEAPFFSLLPDLRGDLLPPRPLAFATTPFLCVPVMRLSRTSPSSRCVLVVPERPFAEGSAIYCKWCRCTAWLHTAAALHPRSSAVLISARLRGAHAPLRSRPRANRPRGDTSNSGPTERNTVVPLRTA